MGPKKGFSAPRSIFVHASRLECTSFVSHRQPPGAHEPFPITDTPLPSTTFVACGKARSVALASLELLFRSCLGNPSWTCTSPGSTVGLTGGSGGGGGLAPAAMISEALAVANTTEQFATPLSTKCSYTTPISSLLLRFAPSISAVEYPDKGSIRSENGKLLPPSVLSRRVVLARAVQLSAWVMTSARPDSHRVTPPLQSGSRTSSSDCSGAQVDPRSLDVVYCRGRPGCEKTALF
jgi:hypothetical protein